MATTTKPLPRQAGESDQEYNDRLFAWGYEEYGDVAVYLTDEQLTKLAYEPGWRIDIRKNGWSPPYRLVEDGEDQALLAQLLEFGWWCETDEVGRVTLLRQYIDETRATADDHLRLAAPLQHVENLALELHPDSNEQGPTDAGLQHLARWRSLKCIDIEGSGHWTGRGFNTLSITNPLSSLEVFDVSDIQEPNSILIALEGASQLKHLTLVQMDLTDRGTERLSRFSELREVRLTKTRVTCEGIAPPKDELNWIHLGLEGCPVSDSGLIWVVENAPDLEEIFLGGAALTDRSIKALAELTNLKTLSISGSNVTNEGLRALSRLQRLESLFITETRLDNSSVPILADFPALTALWCRGSQITKKGKATLRRALGASCLAD